MKKYITWKAIQVNPTKIIHPNTDNFWDYNGGGKFIETSFSNGLNCIGILEDSDIIETLFNFNIQEKTEEEINVLLNEWYNGDVTVKDFKFIDNRPLIN